MNKLLFKLGISLLIFFILLVFNHLPYFNIFFLPEIVTSLFYLWLVYIYKLNVSVSLIIGLVLIFFSPNAAYFIFWIAICQWLLSHITKLTLGKNFFAAVKLEKIRASLKKAAPILILIALTLIPRLILAVNFFGTSDTITATDIINVFFQGKDVYDQGYTYPPLWMFIILFIKFVSLQLSIPFNILLRFPAITADVFLSLLIFLTLQKRQESAKNAFFGSLLFALNPIAILVSGYHGQIDTVWLLFGLSAWYVFEFYRSTWKNLITSAFLLSVGAALKVFPVLFIPLFLMKIKERKKQLIFLSLAVLPLLISLILPILTSFAGVYTNFINYGIEHNFWGTSAIFSFFHFHLVQNKSFYLLYQLSTTPQLERFPLYGFLLFIYLFLRAYKKSFSIPQGMFLIMTGVLLLTPFISVQWWVWLIPLAIVAGQTNKYFFYYTFFITLVLISRYYLYLRNIPQELTPIGAREAIKGIKIDSVNKVIAFGVWVMLWKWLIMSLRGAKRRGNLRRKSAQTS